ncbi:MAG: DUF4422 domain-containing protein [Selenomonadaceae bacterium]|nr:DUF4422 domain-containing protein [Selenomonadaceae bacterium]
MHNDLSFMPRILLCGDEAEFFSRVGQRPFKIVGRMQLAGTFDGQPINFLQDGRIFLDGKIQHFNELLQAIQGAAFDYLVFNSSADFNVFFKVTYSMGFMSPKVVTLEQFKNTPREFFCDVNADMILLAHFKNIALKSLLDVDGYFAKGQLFTKGNNDFTAMDCISDKPLLPIKENLYRRVYRDFAEVGYRRYDAALIAERPPIDFMSEFIFLERFTDLVITFARTGSELEKYIIANANIFAEGNGLRTAAGSWFFLKRHKPKENFCVYVVTHKPTPHEGKLPEGYKIIHAGRAVNPDLGYIGDNTGDNISDLNLYINEVTALYWFWKNANDTVVGLAHYRRFFTESNDTAFAYDKILTKDAALRILQDFVIIVSTIYYGLMTQHEFVENDCGVELPKLGETIIRKYLLQAQPDYLDAFDYVLNSTTFYKCNMFVTRRDVLDAYCRWLFSFYIDATQEILRTVELHKITDKRRRIMGYFSERMMMVYLMKNHLRIKELNIMQVEGL